MKVPGIPGDLGRAAAGTALIAAAPLRGLPALLPDVLGDLRRIAIATQSMAEAVRVLPGVAETLVDIDRHVESMEREVMAMRKRVDALEERTIELRSDLAPVSRMAGRFSGRRARREAAAETVEGRGTEDEGRKTSDEGPSASG